MTRPGMNYQRFHQSLKRLLNSSAETTSACTIRVYTRTQPRVISRYSERAFDCWPATGGGSREVRKYVVLDLSLFHHSGRKPYRPPNLRAIPEIPFTLCCYQSLVRASSANAAGVPPHYSTRVPFSPYSRGVPPPLPLSFFPTCCPGALRTSRTCGLLVAWDRHGSPAWGPFQDRKPHSSRTLQVVHRR